MTARHRLSRQEVAKLPVASPAELLLAVQLEQAGIPFEREYRFDPDRKWRADFVTGWRNDNRNAKNMGLRPFVATLLVEVEGGIGGVSRHLTYTGFTADCEKYAAAAILGYRVIRATTEQVNDGRCLAWIRAALGLEAA